MKLKKILKGQNTDGSFSINNKKSQLYTAIIANILLQKNKDPEILEKICQYFLENKSPAWTFNIYTTQEKILPDDLFTSSLVWYTLYKYNPKLLKTKDLAKITQTLTLLEKKEGGPYQNWLVAPNSSEKWLSTQFSSNKMLQQFLKLLDIDLDNLNNYLKKENSKDDYITKDLYKFLQGEKNDLKPSTCEFPNDIKIKFNFNLKIEKTNKSLENQNLLNKEQIQYINNIKTTIFKRLKKAGPEINQATKPLIDKIFNNKMGQIEIILFPTLFTNLFPQTTFPSKLLEKLSLANFWCWLAYTIYDDFLDNEGNITYLSTANLALRECNNLYFQINQSYPNLPIHQTLNELLDKIDNANTWETMNCRFDSHNPKTLLNKDSIDYKNFNILHHRSIGQAISPLTLALISGYNKDSNQYKKLYNFIKHYLIAKQLNDDCHDFQKDFKAGQLTSVINESIKDLKKEKKQKKFDQENIYQYFIHQSLAKIVPIINDHIKKAQKNIKILKKDLNPLLESTLINLANSAQQALQEQTDTKNFINEYENLQKQS